MKKYRKCLADVSVMKTVLMFLNDQVEEEAKRANDCREYAKQNEEDGEGNCYYTNEAIEHEALSAAYERLMERLSKYGQ